MTTATLRRPGRKCSGPNEIRVMAGGAIRLSPDLSFKSGYVYVITAKAPNILLVEAPKKAPGAKRLAFSNAKARSPIIKMLDVFAFLGKNPEELAGVYAAQRIGEFVVLDFSHRK